MDCTAALSSVQNTAGHEAKSLLFKPAMAATELQQTVGKIAGFTGTALHTGEKVTLRLHPAPVDHGIKFKRKDLQDEPTIDATIENLKTVERATTIGEGSVRVHTVEHVLAALWAMGVDNAIVEMDANEPPIGDRSAVAVSRAVPSGDGGLDTDQVMQILPHRFPFLMVDRIISFETETKCVGVKTVTINEPFFQGHFPGHPVMPGVMQVEAMAQVASILLFKLAKTTSRIGYFMSADEVKFRKPVLPGDTIFIHAELTKSRGERLAKAKCHCVVNDTVVSEAELMFTFLDK